MLKSKASEPRALVVYYGQPRRTIILCDTHRPDFYSFYPDACIAGVRLPVTECEYCRRWKAQLVEIYTIKTDNGESIQVTSDEAPALADAFAIWRAAWCDLLERAGEELEAHDIDEPADDVDVTRK